MKARKSIILLTNYCRVKYLLPAIFMLLAVAPIPQAFGGSPPILPPAGFTIPQEEGKGFSPHQSRRDFERYLKDKYKEISNAESMVKQTPLGPEGDLFITGNIVPRKKAEINLSALPDRHAKSMAIAKAFMEDETVLLGVDNPDELRIFNISTDKGAGGDYTDITYQKYVNGIRYQGGIHLTIGPDYNVRGVSATLRPVSPEVYKATKRKTLTEEEIRAIVDNDLTEDEKRDYERKKGVMTFKKYAIASPPYVIWETSKEYTYTIDAFTGKILTKHSNIIPLYPSFK